MTLVNCYNKGCNKTFDPNENTETACCYHSGIPVFHEGLKGWSCCEKRKILFEEFLEIPGCSFGFHNNTKPEVSSTTEFGKDGQKSNNSLTEKQIPLQLPLRKPVDLTKPDEEPENDNDFYSPNINFTDAAIASFKAVFEEEQRKQIEFEKNGPTLGMPCINKGCTYQYQNNDNLNDNCQYHSGEPVFHEGYKYWNCCNKKTTDFQAFLDQKGCTFGSHLYMKLMDKVSTQVCTCRYDYFQSSKNITVCFYSKNIQPESVKVFITNRVLKVSFIGDSTTKNVLVTIQLKKAVEKEKTSVRVLPTKLEVVLEKQKSDIDWSNLEC